MGGVGFDHGARVPSCSRGVAKAHAAALAPRDSRTPHQPVTPSARVASSGLGVVHMPGPCTISPPRPQRRRRSRGLGSPVVYAGPRARPDVRGGLASRFSKGLLGCDGWSRSAAGREGYGPCCHPLELTRRGGGGVRGAQRTADAQCM